jgi:exodeoxyribonuclease VIII
LEHEGKFILAPDAFERCQRCIDAVLEHPAARYLLDGARREVSAFWFDQRFGVPAKARFDALNHGGIIDLKTTINASPDDFARQAASLGYHIQSAAYNSGHEHVLDSSMAFFAFICVETEPPYGVAVYELASNAVLAGARLWDMALERYAQALKAGRWDSYPLTVQRLELPRWALIQGA